MSLVCINVTNIFFCRAVFFPAFFLSRTANLSSGVDVLMWGGSVKGWDGVEVLSGGVEE